MGSQSMTNVHRLFLLSFMSHGLKSAKQVTDLYQLIQARYPNEDIDNLADVVNTINEHIKHVNIEIKKASSEDTGAIVMVW